MDSMIRVALLVGLLIASTCVALAGGTLDDVRAAAVLACGVTIESEDYSKSESHGDLSDLGLDVCRAVAAVVLGDASKVTPAVFPDDTKGLAAVASGKIALLAGGTPNLADQAAYGIHFGPPVFLDGQGFLVRKQDGLAAIKDLDGKQVCYITETRAEDDLIDGLARRGVRVIPFPFEETGEMEAALVTGHCATIAASVSQLAGMHKGFHAKTSAYEIMPETISVLPFAPAYKAGDPHWAEIVAWTRHALVLAEEAGVTRANAAALRDTGRPAVRYLLGGVPGIGKPLGLDDGWAFRAIQAVGNYAEMFDRDVGEKSPLRIARGRNALWTQGGGIYAPSVR
jgi:general L-amino acid transport system substrate-binding protein